ncbi:MAG: DUF4830 domain-containing protein [Clostridia bacterium]|nr:DUF4830 domain-containing protein [Clostridia bacterium]
MFIVSMKTTRSRVIAYAAVTAALFVTVLSLAGRQDTLRAQAAATGIDDSSRAAYLQQLGYEVTPQALSVQEVQIPADTDEVFTAYNALQTAEHDLTAYCGERVKCWTYAVTNYPGETQVQAHLYVYKNQIIGGDISSVREGGFCHGLQPLSTVATGEANGQTG